MPSPLQPPPEDDLVVRGLLGLLARGETTMEAVERALGRHVVTGCPGCQERTAAGVVALLRPTRPGGTKWLGVTTEVTLTSRSKKGQASEVEPLRAEQAVSRLKGLASLAERLDLVQRQHYDFRGAAVARAFLVEALAALPGSPKESDSWAELAHLAAGFDNRHYCADDEEQAVLALRTELYRANALRCRGQLDEADNDLENAIFDARQLGVSDSLFWAEAKSFGTALKRARREFDEALQQAHFAVALWAHREEPAWALRTRLQIASIHEQLGEYAPALTAIRSSEPLVQAVQDRSLTFEFQHADVFLLARSGRVREAASAFSVLQPRYSQFPRKENYRLWTEGLISAGLEQPAEAEGAFRAARDGFLAVENPYDAALVTLDWSLFLLDHNRAEEVLPLAVSMGQAFEALGVARETLASWAIFQQAAESRELSRAVTESLVRTLGGERAGAKAGR